MSEQSTLGSAEWPLAAATVRTSVRIPLQFGDGFRTEAQVFTFDGLVDGQEHVALGLGRYTEAQVPLVRLHSECLTGDVFGSARCDCGAQLRAARRRVRAEQRVLLLYLRQEGRGVGLLAKAGAYALQDAVGLDTLQANLRLGLPGDARDYAVAARILRELGVGAVRLLTNNPAKIDGLRRAGIVTQRLPLWTHPRPESR